MNHLLEYESGEQDMLLVDWCDSGIEFCPQLVESANGVKSNKFKGKFQEAETVNKNKRMYPYDVLNENVKRLQEVVGARGLIGELDHPSDSIIHFDKASHLITKLWWENNVLMGEGEVLNTPHGKILKSLMDSGVRIGISSRGVGNGKTNEDGILVIGNTYKLITFDAVADPSTFAAFQEKVSSDRREVTSPPNFNSEPKNEARSINKEALKALLGSKIQEQLNESKARLG